MSTQRFTPEFKAEAIRQVIERGYSVADIAERLGVSTHSLYKWVKAVTPDKTEKQASELLEAKSEIFAVASPNTTAGRRARHVLIKSFPWNTTDLTNTKNPLFTAS